MGTLLAAGDLAYLEVSLRRVLSIQPTTNYGLASPVERSDQMESLAHVLMGLSHPLQLISRAEPVIGHWDWSQSPRTRRTWLAVLSNTDGNTLDWQTRTLKKSLEGVGFHADVLAASDGDTPVDSSNSDRDVALADLGLDRLGDEPLPPVCTAYRDAVFDGTRWSGSLVLRRWPREVAPGWLGQALSGDIAVDAAIHIVPQDAQRIARFLKKQQAWQVDADPSKPDAGNQLGRQDAESVRLKLIAHTDKPVKVAVVLTVHADTREDLRQQLSTLTHEVGIALGDVRLATFEHDRGLEATSPTGRCNLLGAWRTLDCTSVASTGIFYPTTVLHEHGAALGTTHEGAMLFKLDPFDLSLRSFGGLITGSVGSGKSYLLKLLLLRLRGVELRIVEHSDPPEYDDIPNLQIYSVADLSEAEQAVKLREYITDLWALARREPRPRLLVLDELWSVLKRPELALLVEEIARRGRKYGLALWIATQQVEELIESGKAVFDNATIKIFLQQEDRDLEGLCKAAHLSAPARRLLRTAARGQALIDCGKMLVLVDIQSTPEEHRLITTDLRETWAATRSMLSASEGRDDALAEATGDSRGDWGSSVLRGSDPVGSPGRNRRAVVPVQR